MERRRSKMIIVVAVEDSWHLVEQSCEAVEELSGEIAQLSLSQVMPFVGLLGNKAAKYDHASGLYLSLSSSMASV